MVVIKDKVQYMIIIVDNDSTLAANLTALVKYKECKDGLIHFDEYGLVWPMAHQYYRLVDTAKLLHHEYDSTKHVLLYVTDPKKWLLTRIKYGV